MSFGVKSIEWGSRGNMRNANDESRDESGKNGEAGASSCESLMSRCYEICIGGRLDSSWSDWFEGLDMRACGENWTMLSGRVPDQAALLGILNKICRLNLPLVSVNQVKQPEGGEKKD